MKFTWGLSVLFATWNNLKLFKDKKAYCFNFEKTVKSPSPILSSIYPVSGFLGTLPQRSRLVPDKQYHSVADRGGAPLLPPLTVWLVPADCWLLETPIALQLTAFFLAAWGGQKCQGVSAPGAPSAGAEGCGEYIPQLLRPSAGTLSCVFSCPTAVPSATALACL